MLVPNSIYIFRYLTKVADCWYQTTNSFWTLKRTSHCDMSVYSTLIVDLVDWTFKNEPTLMAVLVS